MEHWRIAKQNFSNLKKKEIRGFANFGPLFMLQFYSKYVIRGKLMSTKFFKN